MVQGGAGSAVAEYLNSRPGMARVRLLQLGLPDHYIEHATQQQQLAIAGLDVDSVAARVSEFAAAAGL